MEVAWPQCRFHYPKPCGLEIDMFDEFDEFDVFERALALTKPKGSERNCFVNKNHNPHGFVKPFTSLHNLPPAFHEMS